MHFLVLVGFRIILEREYPEGCVNPWGHILTPFSCVQARLPQEHTCGAKRARRKDQVDTKVQLPVKANAAKSVAFPCAAARESYATKVRATQLVTGGWVRFVLKSHAC